MNDIILLAAQRAKVAPEKILAARMLDDGSIVAVMNNGIAGCPKVILQDTGRKPQEASKPQAVAVMKKTKRGN